MAAKHKEHSIEDEDASELKLGPDFTDAKCLLISEVAVILEHRAARNMDDSGMNAVIDKTHTYVKRFNKFRSKEVTAQVRGLFENYGLTEFEVAALCNLNPVTPDEAKSLIPTLSRKLDNDQLDALLANLATLSRA
eukprot:GILI01003562.1.p1 GENE.GILI01003562.1~~GILI01003562.1.p1  ORF type:complete len:136 (-),score=19.78 GILI01003562.1:442-849(-)